MNKLSVKEMGVVSLYVGACIAEDVFAYDGWARVTYGVDFGIRRIALRIDHLDPLALCWLFGSERVATSGGGEWMVINGNHLVPTTIPEFGDIYKHCVKGVGP